MKRTTIDDVASAAGVSRQTVSRAINDKGEILPATKSHVLAVARELGYRPNRMAQAMITQRSHMVGLLIPDITNPFFSELARGVQDAGLARDYLTLICNTDEMPMREMAVVEMLSAHGVDGLITFIHPSTDAQLKKFANTFRPILLINRLLDHPNIILFLADNFKGALLAVEHLTGLGHREIIMLTNEDAPLDDTRRVRGFRLAMQTAGLACGPERILAARTNAEGGYTAMVALLQNQPAVTAVFCYNDLMAFGAIRACHDQGWRVPQDISIVGFDNLQFGSMFIPALTSIGIDTYKMGQIAMQTVLEAIAAPDKATAPLMLGAELFVRETTAPPKA